MRVKEFILEREISKTYILYVNGTAVSKYDSEAEADYEGRKLVKSRPKWTYEVKTETCTVENFADGKIKGKSRPGRVKKSGASCSGSVTDLRAKAKKYGGEKGKMYHWCANMKSGKNK